MGNEGEEIKNTSERKEDQEVPFYKLFSFADRLDVSLITIGTISAIANGLTQPIMTLIFGQFINSFGGTDSSHVVHEVSKVSVKFMYLGVGAGTATLLQIVCWMVTGERQAVRIRRLYLKTILRQDIEFFDTQTTAEVTGRISRDTILIQEAMGENVGKYIQFISAFFGSFAIAFVKGWRLALVLSASFPALVIAGGCVATIKSKMSSRGQIAHAEVGNVVEQTVGAIRMVQSYTGEKLATEKYDSKLQIAFASTVKQGLASGFGIGMSLVISFSTYGLAVWYGAKLILDEGYNGGVVINVIMSIMIGELLLGQSSSCLNAFAAGQAAAYKMFETIKRTPKIDAADSRGIMLEDMKGEIELKDVYFRYPARPEVQIFAGFSLHVPFGKTAALVGQSGSGKSTVISLLERFYDPDAGEVLIDGFNLKELNLRWIRGKIGLVSQEPILFATTIKENILYGKEDARDEEIRRAVELANAAKFIDKLPLGLDTIVGEHGTQLSRGQKQRIAIARAILKNPRILLLDEATSALDAESECIVQEALDNVMTDRTTVVVAHRLTTIRNADIIAVVHSGKLVEQGTHVELIQDPVGAYTQLLRIQEGTKQSQTNKGTVLHKPDAFLNLKRSLSKYSSHRNSVRRSTSNGSSRHSFTLACGVRGFINIQGAQSTEDHVDEMDENILKKHKKVSIRRLVHLNRPEWPYLLLGSIGAGTYGIMFPIFGLLFSSAIRIFYAPPHELRKDSKFWGLMMVLLGACSLVAPLVQNYFLGIAGGKLIQRIRSLTFKKVVHQEISWFDDPANSSGAVGARLSTDASTVRSLVGDALALIVQNISTVIGGLVIAFAANWLLAIIIVAVVPLIGLHSFLQMKFYKGFTSDTKTMYEEASQVANNAIGSIRTVASFGAEDKVMRMYETKCKTPLKQGISLGIVSGASFGVSSFMLYCTEAFFFCIGAVLIEHGKASFGEVFKVFFALTMSATVVSQASATAPDVNKVKVSAASIFEILDSRPKIDSSSDKGTTLATLNGDIELKHISFKYPTRPDIQIFRDLSLNIPAGKTVALVGESGSGKSTIISLIQRFYNPDLGQIFLDGVEIQKFKLSWLRQQMGLVSQEAILFNETIRANIAYGKKGEVTEEEIIAATKAANAHNFISGLPRGYDTNIGERGVQLSGGQKQRIAIARAILKDPKILLLDEATSALDAESERVVQEALDKVMANRTSVVVAHRLTTIFEADIIAVVKNGVVCEKGRHDVLMKTKDGVYASLVALHTSSG
ncbi:Multidrug/pheromone exporter, ABC superfamily [Handroanthus impetiginosus]|uniref:Multidrug/pheromone exporter, ABC superfamily n=1 Tax=Handroanthus impetiginosus TaxID=429701 RepID=A0A2G9I7D9_9LAMI|nr:Multidrug/pheromone exporter, ABC superfamily [Handroanthus impetiginosus]